MPIGTLRLTMEDLYALVRQQSLHSLRWAFLERGAQGRGRGAEIVGGSESLVLTVEEFWDGFSSLLPLR